MLLERLALPLEAIAQCCQRYGVKELAVFGSALREDFDDESDVDFLVEFHDDDYGPWMEKLTCLAQDLSDLLHREIDLVPKPGLKWVIRDQVLASAQTIYVDPQ